MPIGVIVDIAVLLDAGALVLEVAILIVLAVVTNAWEVVKRLALVQPTCN